ncbi:MAG TPA: mechanosensitive ion channel family protein [Casimicrobiaceae bacterium]|nr:mechanosensitive ion channel family protein [Casimicrobiaceae bacterium]
MFIDVTMYDAALFTAAAALLTVIALLFGVARARGLLPMVVVMLVGLVALGLSNVYGGRLESPTAQVIVRELALAIVAFGFIKVAVLFVLQTVLARRGIPRILDDFIFALALIAYAIYRLNAVGVNLAGLITTSAVITGALAFSAQETLGNLWGGIALQMEKTCRIGDWVRIDDVAGQVVSIRWRYMAIATNANETIVIPNSQVMKNRVVLVGRRGEDSAAWRRIVSFEIDYDEPPTRVISIVETALDRAEIPLVAKEPQPKVMCQKFMESGVEYAVVYFLMDPARDIATDSRIRQHVFAALLRNGLRIPYPRRIVEVREDERVGAEAREQDIRMAALGQMDLFAPLTDEERDKACRQLQTCLYAPGDVLFHAGEQADSLYLLARGRVEVMGVNRDTKARFKLATLEAPAYFGEMGLLLGQPRSATVVAAGEALCYRLDKSGFDAVLHARPELAGILAKLLAQRQAANDATLQALDAEARARQAVSRATDLVRKIQHFFGLSAESAK